MADDPKIVLALITASASLAVAVFNYFGSRKAQLDIELLKAENAERKSETDARRDYEYEAKKRLYKECEPLLFQLFEVSENALHRVYSLARTARQGNLDSGNSWLAGPGYYMTSTIYNLLAPVAIFKLIHQRLTFIDLTVEPHIKAQYNLAKAIYISFTDAFDFARMKPEIHYEPNNPKWRQMRAQNQKQVWQQGLPVGRLDVAAEGLLLRESSGSVRLRSFGEFEQEFHNHASALRGSFVLVSDIFLDFHPEQRPVLWRMLITQAYIYRALLQTGRNGSKGTGMPIQPIPPDKRTGFEWRKTPSEASIESVLEEPFSVAERYLKVRLGRQFAG
jgi:hypothetical protein